MAGSRGKVINDDAKLWVGGKLPTAEYYAKMYARERELARKQVERELLQRRARRQSAAAAAQASSD